MIFKSSY
jgi:hypothetical protein